MNILSGLKSAFFKRSGVFFTYFITSLIMMILALVFELISVSGSFKYDGFYILFKTIEVNLFFAIYYSGIFASIFLLIDFISHSLSRYLFVVVLSIATLTSIACIIYFLNTTTPLDHIVFTLKIADLKETVVNQGSSFSYLGLVVLIPFMIILCLGLIRKRVKSSFKLYSVLIPTVVVVVTISLIKPKIYDFGKAKYYYQIENKLYYFLKSSNNYLSAHQGSDTQIFPLKEIMAYQSLSDKKYINRQYPLISEDNSDDILGKLLNKPTQKPNFVFIIVESLSRLQSGPNAQYGSFTPFLDSLSQHSLYWENCLSTSGRTFNVIPSIFGSLPYAESGFAHLRDKMPDHTTIIKILNLNNYYSSFFYGDWYGFDDMGYFMKRQQIDYLIPSFDAKYKKMDKDENGFTWGYPDDAVYTRAAGFLDSLDISIPRIDIYLTVSSHEPWKYPHSEQYQIKAKEILKKTSKLTADTEYFSLQLGAFLYVDDSIRKLIGYYQKRKDFGNTIFVITGDHRAYIPVNNELQTYHVPLIIYSKLIKQASTFKGVTSHLAIAPTINKYLQKSLQFDVPLKTSWLGETLPNDTGFSCRVSLPLMRANKDLIEYVENGYYLFDKTLYRINSDFSTEACENPEIQLKMENKLLVFKSVNKYVCTFNCLFSESFSNPDFILNSTVRMNSSKSVSDSR